LAATESVIPCDRKCESREGRTPDEIRDVLTWFTDSLHYRPDTFFGRLGHYLDEDRGFQEFASAFLKASSTGVDHLKVRKRSFHAEDLRSLLPANVVSRLLKDVDQDGTSLIRIDEGNELLIERKGEDRSIELAFKQFTSKGPATRTSGS